MRKARMKCRNESRRGVRSEVLVREMMRALHMSRSVALASARRMLLIELMIAAEI